MIEMLANAGQLAASNIAAGFRMSASAISQHLKALRQARLVAMEKRKQQRIYTINPLGMSDVERWAQTDGRALRRALQRAGCDLGGRETKTHHERTRRP